MSPTTNNKTVGATSEQNRTKPILAGSTIEYVTRFLDD